MPGIRAGQVYGFRAHGPWAPERGLRFDGDRILLDPYGARRGRAGRLPATAGSQGEHGPGDDDLRAMKSVVVDLASYDWEGDRPLDRPFADTVIYEAHVRGFTANPNRGVDPALRGTYAGFIEKIPYLVDLGITAVELLPVYAVRRPGSPGRPPELLGLPARVLLRPARRLRQPAGRAGRGRRVPGPREGAPSGGPRGHP